MYRLKSLFLVCLFSVVAFFAGCNDKDKQPEIIVENETALSQTVFADKTNGTSGVTIITAGAWTSTITEGSAKSAKAGTATWVSINPDHGDAAGTYTIVISLEPNATGTDRTATINIACMGGNISITVTQKGTKEDGEPYMITFEGSGTSADPYQIGAAAQLARLARLHVGIGVVVGFNEKFAVDVRRHLVVSAARQVGE